MTTSVRSVGRSLGTASSLGLALALVWSFGCEANVDTSLFEPDAQVSTLDINPDISSNEVLSRAEEWVNAQLHYCQAPNHERDFDSASRAFDAARSRTHDKDEQKFITAAIGDLATIKVR